MQVLDYANRRESGVWSHRLYSIKLFAHIHMSARAGQTAGQNWLKFVVTPGVTKGKKKIKFLKI